MPIWPGVVTAVTWLLTGIYYYATKPDDAPPPEWDYYGQCASEFIQNPEFQVPPG